MEPVSLFLGAAGVTTLFSTCIECFNVVITSREFSEDYEQLFALLFLSRTRLQIWGESVGLASNPNNGSRLNYDKNLDRPDIRPEVQRTLNNIKALLEEAGRINAKYGPPSPSRQGREPSALKGIAIFKESYGNFRLRMRKHQRETSTWKTTQWAVHDCNKLEESVDRLEKLVDGLEKMTVSLGLLQQQRKRLEEEIESISDIHRLSLLRDVSSRTPSLLSISDAASRQLVKVTGSINEKGSIHSNAFSHSTSYTFITAQSRSGNSSSFLRIPGAWSRSVRSKLSLQSLVQSRQQTPPPTSLQSQNTATTILSCNTCLAENSPCIPDPIQNRSCGMCAQMGRSCSFVEAVPRTSRSPRLSSDIQQEIEVLTSPLDQILPLSTEVQRAERNPPLMNFPDTDFGQRLSAIKTEDENYWDEHSGKIFTETRNSSSIAKRMYIDLRSIRSQRVPFISAVPLNENLHEVLASIEGPPRTPYEGGIFWITIQSSNEDDSKYPLLRFHTKVYHPNISPQGQICADYMQRWTPLLPVGAPTPNSKPEISQLTCEDKKRGTLGSLLTTLCALLASPDIEDHLVPEIAQTYREDYERYCENARLYTKRFASGERPGYDELLFPAKPCTGPSRVVSRAASMPTYKSVKKSGGRSGARRTSLSLASIVANEGFFNVERLQVGG